MVGGKRATKQRSMASGNDTRSSGARKAETARKLRDALSARDAGARPDTGEGDCPDLPRLLARGHAVIAAPAHGRQLLADRPRPPETHAGTHPARPSSATAGSAALRSAAERRSGKEDGAECACDPPSRSGPSATVATRSD